MNKAILSHLEKIITFVLAFFFLGYILKMDISGPLAKVISKPQAAIQYLFGSTPSSSTSTASKETTLPMASTDKAEFDRAIPFTLRHEGGLVNDKADKGGITKYGISYTYLRHLLAHNTKLLSALSSTHTISPAIIKHMTKQEAIQIYFTQWWEKYHFGSIKKQPIATKAFDYAVNMGVSPAIKLLQTACRHKAGTHAILVNGKLDQRTLHYINNLNPTQTQQLLADFEKVVANHYLNIAKHHPRDKKFVAGWLQRAYDQHGLVV
jgi:lysozyme family protein